MAIILDDSETTDRRIKMLLETAQVAGTLRNQREELALKKQELDPRVQAGKMANMMMLMGNTEGAQKMFEYSKTGVLPQGVQLPSQAGTQPNIPNYMGGQTQLPSAGVQLPSSGVVAASPMGMTGGGLKVGGASVKFGTPALSPMDDANIDIHKTLTTEKLKKEQENASSSEKTLSGTDRYLKQFDRSWEELKRYDPEIDSVGMSGWMSRRGADVMNKLDAFPETAAMKKMAKPFAQELATALEGRATDEDRKVQIDTMADTLRSPSAENTRIAANSLLTLKDKGADISKVVKKLASTKKGSPMYEIAQKIYEDAPELKPKSINVDNLFEGL